MTAESVAPERINGVSRSLERLVRKPDDIVGLIAYGLFKIEQSEWARAAKPNADEVDRFHLQLQDTRIGVLRSSAESMLQRWGTDLEEVWREDYRAELQAEVDEGMVARIEERVAARMLADQKAHTLARMARDIAINVAGWLFSLVIVALVVLTVYGPSIGEVIRRLTGG